MVSSKQKILKSRKQRKINRDRNKRISTVVQARKVHIWVEDVAPKL